MLIPAFCDLIGTTLSGIGLLYIQASIWQLLRGSVIIFTGILSKIFLKRKLYKHHYIGMFVVILGLIFVGYAGLKVNDKQGLKVNNPNNPNSTLIGMILVILGMIINAIQFVVEEIFLKDKQIHPLMVVGYEGVYGALLTAFIAIPITYYIPLKSGIDGRYENIIDAFVQLKNNPILIIYSVSALFTIASYNYLGLNISQHVSSLTRAVTDSLRTIIIWLFFIILYYQTNGQIGEPWNQYSYFEVIGFILLILGTLIYAKAF